MMRSACIALVTVATFTGCARKDESPPAGKPVAEPPTVTAQVGPMAATLPEAPPSIEGVEWQWVKTISSADSTWESPNREKYTLRLEAERAAGAADCNRFTGPYTLTGRDLAFGAMAVTRAMCPPESLGDRYTRWLGQVASQFTRGDTLFLELKFDSGTMVFVR